MKAKPFDTPLLGSWIMFTVVTVSAFVNSIAILPVWWIWIDSLHKL